MMQLNNLICNDMKNTHNVCLTAISRDFLDIVLPNPVLPVAVEDDFASFRIPKSDASEAFRSSCTVATCPLKRTGIFITDSVSLPFVTVGDECLLGEFTEAIVSEFPFIAVPTPCRDLPAKSGLSVKSCCKV